MIPSKLDTLFFTPFSICSGDIVNYMENHKRQEFGILRRSVKEEPELALLSSKENTGPAPESEFQRSILKVQDNWDQRT